ncbi:hypothetical protein [Bradyrhizobium prioriisuperbiae]|uniref:hypothetical protein n=1 Tax=Bradyrhizobium prioriisuperbiae TaxID=2854389 RepID=UPI0028EA8B4A|nr:hypothetical protein [Bradyrhizobium prioritasuperba]
MSGSSLSRFDAHTLRLLIVTSALCWSAAFVIVAMLYQLELYGDGAMFSYAVAVQDAWAFHWHNISGRTSVYLLCLLPAEMIVGLTDKPWAGILAYGFLFYVTPLASLILTFVIDRSRGRFLFLGACCSTTLLCPLVFGFPTEMWVAHAMFWPVLAICHYARRTWTGAALVFIAQLGLAFTHEGALILLVAIVVTLAPRGLRNGPFVRAATSLVVVVVLAVISKLILPPDDYYASALLRAALHVFDPAIFKVEVVLLLLVSLTSYGVLYAAVRLVAPARAHVYSLGVLLMALIMYWLAIDHAVLANNRYYLRTLMVIGTPIFGVLAALAALSSDGIVVRGFARLQFGLTSPTDNTIRAFAAVLLLTTAIHVVETGKFVSAWTRYRAAITALATGQNSDPQLGNSNFVSSSRTPPGLAPLAWFSTIPYLSVMVANFSPSRLVIDPAGNYFWLSCETATTNRNAARAAPVEAREFVRIYSCLHR